MSAFDYSTGATLLTIDNICLSYDRPILKNINEEVKDVISKHVTTTGQHEIKGQIVCLLGPSGIGKTQLFRIIAGLNQPTSGKVYINNCACGSATCTKEKCIVHAGDVGVVAQNYPLFPHHTIRKNLEIAAKHGGLDKVTAATQIATYAKNFNLASHLDKYPHTLSGGQRQRAAIIQQVLCSKHYMLMDEPFSGLDPVSLEEVSLLIQQTADLDERNTIIIVTHDIAAACAVADELWLMGREHNAAGEPIPGASIVKKYNLIDEDLAWHPNIKSQPQFHAFVAKLLEEFNTL